MAGVQAQSRQGLGLKREGSEDMCTVVISRTDVESLDTGVREAAQGGRYVVRGCSWNF